MFARLGHTSHRVEGTSVPSGCRAAAARHQTTRLSMSCQLCGDAKGPATFASSSRSSIAFASLHLTKWHTQCCSAVPCWRMAGLWQVHPALPGMRTSKNYSLLGAQICVPKEAGLNATRTCQDRLVTIQKQCLAHEQAPSWGAVQALASLLKRMHALTSLLKWVPASASLLKWVHALASLLKRMQQLNIVFYLLGETSINTHDLVICLI